HPLPDFREGTVAHRSLGSIDRQSSSSHRSSSGVNGRGTTLERARQTGPAHRSPRGARGRDPPGPARRLEREHPSAPALPAGRRAGPLVFGTLRRTVTGKGGVAVEEEQDLVYRGVQRGAVLDRPTQPAVRSAWHRTVVPDDVLLFRYSALTFNGHRIHYDRRYATAEEGYPGLVVHAPLLATLLLDLLRGRLPDATPERFSFKAVLPTFDVSPFSLEGEPDQDGHRVRLWSTDNDGELGIEAEAVLRPP